jgi:hypothetical protein
MKEMLQFSSGTRQQLPPQLFEQMGRYRREVIVNRLGWELNTINGIELDEFDGPDAVYVCSHDDEGNVKGVARLLPTTGPYLMEKVFPHPRFFEPIRFDPTAQVMAGVNAANMDPHTTYQFNVHQVRVIVNNEVIGVAVPEGPHRDGHLFVMNAVVNRSNISGGVTQLMPTGGGEPFFEDVLLDNEAIIIKDAAMWHHATNILPLNGSSGHRDILIITFNDWAHRRYGEEFERNLGVIHADVN